MNAVARIRMLLVLATFAAVTGLQARSASASQPRLLPGLALRNSTWITRTGVALAPVSSSAALTARLELGPAGTGAALGIMSIDGSSHLRFVDHAGVELKAARTFGPASPTQSIYVGPQLAAGSWSKHATLGWMFDLENPDRNHPQVGLRLGF